MKIAIGLIYKKNLKMQRIPNVLVDKFFYINKFKGFKFELYKQVKLTTDYSEIPSDEIGEALVTINLADKEVWADLLIKEESIKRVSGYYPHLVLEDTTKVENEKSLTIRVEFECKVEKNKRIESEGFSAELEEFITKHLEILKSCLFEFLKSKYAIYR